MKFLQFFQRGQSAIEYLMTYGWMLLIVTVVGGAIFATVGDQEVDRVTGFTGTDVLVENFGLTSSGDAQFQVRNGGSKALKISEINISDSSTGKYISKEFTGDKEVSVAESKLFTLPNLSSSNSPRDLDVEVRYDDGDLSNLTLQGTISGGYEIENTVVTSGSPMMNDNSNEDVEVVDNFEDGDMSEYTDTADIVTNQSSGSYNGGYRLKTDADAYQQGYFSSENSSGGTLPVYPEPGDRVSFRVYMENVTGDQIWMDVGDSAGDYYRTTFDILNDELQLRNSTGTNSTSLSQTPSANSWITIEFDWGESGQLKARWRDENGDVIDEVNTEDSSYSTGNEYISITAYIGSTSDPTYIDYITFEPIE